MILKYNGTTITGANGNFTIENTVNDATLQFQNDNSTKVATTAYVDFLDGSR